LQPFEITPSMVTKRCFFPVVFLLFASAIWLQADLFSRKYERFVPSEDCPWCEDKSLREDAAFIPVRADFLRLLAPADPHFLADLLWLRATYYFGQHALTDRQYPYLFHLLDLITDLSPFWDYPYFFGAVILPFEADAAEDGLYLIEKGLVYHPDNWQLWFFKGFCLWKAGGDMVSAAHDLHRASLLPGAPVYLARLSATLANRAGRKELALRFLEEARKNVHDPLHQQHLAEKIEEILKGE